MRISHIRALNLLNHRVLNVPVPQDANLVLVAGPNGSGKSAMLEGVRAALGAGPPRDIGLKKDMPELITQGEKDGFAGVVALRDGREDEYKFSLKTGNFAGSTPPELGSALYSVNPAAFFALAPTDRRKVLYKHAGISMSKADIVKSLVDQGHAQARVDAIEPYLGAGMGKTAEKAKEKASEARGSWQTVTGETYGAKKGEEWKAEPPEQWDDPGELAEQLRDLLQAQVKAVAYRDELASAERQHQDAEDWRRQAANIPDFEADVTSLKEQIAGANKKLSDYSSAGRAGWTCPCPKCDTVLFSPGPAQLEIHTPSEVAPAVAAHGKQSTTVLLTRLEGELKRQQTGLDNARAAKLALDRLPERPSAAELAEANRDATTAMEEYKIADEAHKRAVRLRDDAGAAAHRTDKAKGYHEDVKAYTALSEALDTLPGQQLGTALKAINLELQDYSEAFGHAVTIGEDMEVRYGTIPYRLLSRSQKWRAQLALAMVLGKKYGLVIIDEFDLVEPAARGPILFKLSQQTDVQVIMGATLKAKPGTLPGVFTHWTGRD